MNHYFVEREEEASVQVLSGTEFCDSNFVRRELLFVELLNDSLVDAAIDNESRLLRGFPYGILARKIDNHFRHGGPIFDEVLHAEKPNVDTPHCLWNVARFYSARVDQIFWSSFRP